MQQVTSRVSRLETVAFAWLSRSAARDDAEVAAHLLRHLPAFLHVHLIGLLNTGLLALLVIMHTGAMWPLAWLVADVTLTGARIWLAVVCRRAHRSGGIAPLERLLAVAVVWVLVTSAGLTASVMTGDASCIVLATGIAAVITGTAIVRNAAVPRYACFVILVIGVPICIAYALSGLPRLWFVGIQFGIGLGGMCIMTWENHQMLVGLLRARIEITRLARRDTLTGLGNRVALYDRLGRWLDRLAKQPDSPHLRVGVMFLDLDRFKEVNDSLGHAAGDALLREVGAAIANLLGPHDFACRSGGDEFVIVRRGVDRPAIEAMAQRIIEAISRPLDIGWPHPVHIGGSIGIATAPEHGLEVDELLSRADAALYRAKSEGRGTFRRSA